MKKAIIYLLIAWFVALICGCTRAVDVGVTWSKKPQWSLDACLLLPRVLWVRSGWELDGKAGGLVGGKFVWGQPLNACRINGWG